MHEFAFDIAKKPIPHLLKTPIMLFLYLLLSPLFFSANNDAGISFYGENDFFSVNKGESKNGFAYTELDRFNSTEHR